MSNARFVPEIPLRYEKTTNSIVDKHGTCVLLVADYVAGEWVDDAIIILNLALQTPREGRGSLFYGDK